jgi:uncharacterized protein YbjT (DUF2867 family)
MIRGSKYAVTAAVPSLQVQSLAMRVLLTGVTGFVGSHILRQLLAESHEVVALARRSRELGSGNLEPKPGANQLRVVDPGIILAPGDVVSGIGLDEAVRGCDAVIHLVGIIMEVGDATFERVHYEGTRNVVQAAKRAGVKRFVQMSALGARADGVSAYQTTKWRAEEEVRQSGMEYVILRPSLIFGPGDGFVRQMIDVMRSAPLFRPVVGSGRYLFRPVYIDDVVTCFVSALTNPAATNQTVELVGGEELTLNEILARIAECVGVKKPAVHVPFGVMYAAAAVLEKVLKRPPVTTDQLRMLSEGSTCDPSAMRRIFGIESIGFHKGLTQYLCRPG